jgi:hypothetical protein
MRTIARGIVPLSLLAIAIAGCATLQQVAALRRVDFSIDRVAEPKLAGVAVERIRNYRDLSALEIAAVSLALARGDLPFEFTLHLDAFNPVDNSVSARLLQMDWTLLVENRETISGKLEREFVMLPGDTTDVPIPIRLDLADFFDKNAQDMVDLALAITGQGGAPKRISLRATPTIQTSIGPIRYPEPITIVSKIVGGM